MEGNLCEECRHTFSTWRPAPGPGSRPSPTGTVTSYVEFKRKRTTLHGTACPMCRTVSAYLGKILVNEHSLERMLSGGSRPGSWSNVIARRLLETAYQFQLMPSLLEYGSVSLTFNYIERSSTDRRRDPVQPPLVALVGPGRPSDHRPNFSILAAHDTPAAAVIPARLPLWDTASDSTFNSIHGWIQDCNSNHQCLTTRAPSSQSPRRVLDVSALEMLPNVRVVELPPSEQRPDYIALSYCWGDPARHKQLRTHKDNIEQHRREIDVSVLPRTIHDAITICRRLRVRYLWVDALCIIQDDDNDRTAEIAEMGAIYAAAYLTIAASAAEGCADGFLKPGRKLPCFSAPIPGPDGTVLEAQWSSSDDAFIDAWDTVQSDSGKRVPVEKLEPLHQRAWTLQEAMLSTRILFVSSFQPYWVCKAGSRAGGVPSSEKWIAAVGLKLLLSPPDAQAASRRSIGSKPCKATDYLDYAWPTTAEHYSSRKLSVLDDKILAIHAVKEFYRKGNGAYVAGAWLDKLHIDLLWSAEEMHERSVEERARFGAGNDRGRITGLPSWSWLSFDGRIENFAHRELRLLPQELAEAYRVVKRVHVVDKPTTDSFGRVVGEKQALRLRCPVKAVLAVPRKGPGWEGRHQHGFCYNTDVWDDAARKYREDMGDLPTHLKKCVGAALFDDFVRLPEDKQSSQHTEKGGEFDASQDLDRPPLRLGCGLIVCGDRDEVDGGTSTSIAFGIFLADVGGSNGRQKRRIGCFKGVRNMAAYFGDAEEMEFDFL